jgi:hypothetical protein
MRKVNSFTIFWLLELYALFLTGVQMLGGVRTDEAKYLLSIPYPHPPLVRGILAMTSEFPFHEFLWRLIFASILIQCVWFFADLGRVLTKQRRLCLCACWLFSSAVVLQAGSIVMAAATAVFGVIFLWNALHPKPPMSVKAIACLWLASLFTAYQSVLFLPLVLSSFLHVGMSKKRIALYLGLPILLLVLYTLTNPHILASMAQASGQDSAMPLLDRLTRIAWVWLLAGGIATTAMGTVGILVSPRWDLVATFGLVLGFIVLTSQHYYAILFTPLLLGGLFILFCKRRLKPGVFIGVQLVGTIIMVIVTLPMLSPSPARVVMKQLEAQGITGPILIDGPFGHEWQYESAMPILKFNQELSTQAESEAQAIVCTRGECDEDVNPEAWVRMEGTAVEVWVRR